MNASGGNDTNNGSSWLNAKQSISNATGTVNPNGTINIANGQYTGSSNTKITLTKNMTIIGESQANTIINGQKSGQPIFTIASGVSVTIIDLTFTNNTAVNGEAIYNNGNLTETNDTFNNNMATSISYGRCGGAIYNNGIITDTNDTFINNTATLSSYCSGGGAIYNNGIITDTNDTFINNTVTSSTYGIGGGAIYNNGIITNTNDIFINNTVTSSSYGKDGGAIYNDNALTIINNTFNYNTATSSSYGKEGGAIFNGGIITDTKNAFNNNIARLSVFGSDGGAIYNIGTISSANDTFNNNTVTFSMYGIGGGAIYNNGIITDTNDTFSNNTSTAGGAIYNDNTLTIANDIFNNNTSTTSNTWVTNGGGAIYNNGKITGANNTFNKNIATSIGSSVGGAIYNKSTISITNNTFKNNTATIGGAIYNEGTTNITFNCIIGNSALQGTQIYNDAQGDMNATENWWGTNTPNLSGNDIVNNGGICNYDPWIILSINVSSPVNPGNSSIVTADLTHDSNGNDTLGYGIIPDGITINFSSGGLGILNPETNITTNGVATTIFTAKNFGNYSINATANNQTVSTTIDVYYPTPVANFIVNVPTGTAPSTVQFTDNSTNIVNGYNWNFGDGSFNNTEQNPSHTYILGGIYTVTETVTGPGGSNSKTSTVNITPDTTAPIVNANLASGVFNSNQTVTLSATDNDLNLEIYYTLNRTNPTTSSTLYTGPLIISNEGINTLEFIAVDTAGNISNPVTRIYTIDTVPPTATANTTSGLYNAPQNITLTMSEPGTIYYTLDGTTHTNTSNQYTGPIDIPANITTILKYLAIDTAGNTSPIYTQTYTIDTVPPTASDNLKGGLYKSNQTITLKKSETGNIYYTLNGTTPTSKSTLYTKPITISSTSTLKYIAIDAANNKSAIYVQNYVIDKTAPKVASTTPVNNAKGVSLTAPITIKFNEKINKGTNFSKIYIKNLTTGKITQVTITLSGNTITIKMTRSRLSLDNYQVYIPTSTVKDLAGNNNSLYTLKFKTSRY